MQQSNQIAEHFKKFHPDTYLQNEIANEFGEAYCLIVTDVLNSKKFVKFEATVEGKILKIRNNNYLLTSINFDGKLSLKNGFKFYGLRYGRNLYLFTDSYFLVIIKKSLGLFKYPVTQTRAAG